ncbi:Hint domain-containing protein [Thalassobius sp. I31.1]|uniref:Hint domain-containing protein n=1 Tax=Thalassobius sp. I31.1 TaxID=2109912 RepID=UPI000D199CF8|nr:Hint domain-containing protein [Thalassobius sp. I31.1]
MPTTYTDQFWLIDPANPPSSGSTLSVFSFNIIDQNDNNLINRFSNDSIDGSDITASYPGDTITVNLPGGGSATITGTTFFLADGRAVFTPSDGSVLQTSTFSSSTFVNGQGSHPVGSLGPPCFVAGTVIEASNGSIPVECLKQGDVLQNYAGQLVKLRMVLSRSYSERQLIENSKLRPVRIMAGTLGRGLPQRDLLVSRQHRMLVSSKIAERMFGTTDVLISAINLTKIPGIYVDENVREVEYFHLVFDQHEVLFAEGAPTESLYAGPEALKSITGEAREEILTIFPELADMDHTPTPALPLPSGKQQKQLVLRHMKNRKPLLEFLNS